jgi:hypothetical protein
MKLRKFPTLLSLCVLLPLGLPFPALAADVARPAALAQFDADVATCRRTIREACALVQELAPQKSPDAAKQAQALALVATARKQWAEVTARHAATPPAEYSTDTQFRARLGDIANSLEDMERALAAGQARRSLHACGFGCGLFVAMHEDNGLVYGLDRLFALRKTAKTAAAVFKTRGLPEAQRLVPVLLRQRDEVWLAPLPWPAGDARNSAYAAGLKTLSSSLDELATATIANDPAKAGAVLNGLVALINEPYGTAL